MTCVNQAGSMIRCLASISRQTGALGRPTFQNLANSIPLASSSRGSPASAPFAIRVRHGYCEETSQVFDLQGRDVDFRPISRLLSRTVRLGRRHQQRHHKLEADGVLADRCNIDIWVGRRITRNASFLRYINGICRIAGCFPFLEISRTITRCPFDSDEYHRWRYGTPDRLCASRDV